MNNSPSKLNEVNEAKIGSPVAEPMQSLNVLLFAGAAERSGSRHLSVQVPRGASIAEIRAALCTAEPRLSQLAMLSRWAVGNEFVNDDFHLPASDASPLSEIAMIPPVSGG